MLAVVAATGLLLPFRPYLHPAQAMLLFVPVIVGIGRLAGVRASGVGAVLAFLAVDFCFVPPYYHLTVASPVDWITLLVFLLVALSSGLQTGAIRQRERAAVQREREIALLSRLSSRLVSEESIGEMANFIAREVVAVLGADRAAVYVRAHGDRASLLAQAGGVSVGVTEAAFADWVMRNDKAVALPLAGGSAIGPHPVSVAADEAVPGSVADGVFLPLQTGESLEGVFYARPLTGAEVSPQGVAHLLAVANLAAAFLERRRLEDAAAQTVAMRESDRLKATLVSSVSHELKTPLAAVTARVTGLLEEGEGCSAARVHEELEAVAEDLQRLDSSIGDLVDVSRLESDAWRPAPELWDIGELLGTVASRIPVASSVRTCASGRRRSALGIGYATSVRSCGPCPPWSTTRSSTRPGLTSWSAPAPWGPTCSCGSRTRVRVFLTRRSSACSRSSIVGAPQPRRPRARGSVWRSSARSRAPMAGACGWRTPSREARVLSCRYRSGGQP